MSNKTTVVARKLGKSYFVSKNGSNVGLFRSRMKEVLKNWLRLIYI